MNRQLRNAGSLPHRRVKDQFSTRSAGVIKPPQKEAHGSGTHFLNRKHGGRQWNGFRQPAGQHSVKACHAQVFRNVQPFLAGKTHGKLGHEVIVRCNCAETGASSGRAPSGEKVCEQLSGRLIIAGKSLQEHLSLIHI